MSELPARAAAAEAEPSDPRERTLARVIDVLNRGYRRPEALPPERVLAQIAAVLADAGYAVAGERAADVETFVRRWWDEGPPQG